MLSGLLFAVAPAVVPTLVGVVAVIVAVLWLASFVPAVRLARVDPAEAMRRPRR